MRLGIFGGGFGLYGYLPASLSLGWEVVTLERYEPFLHSREDLAPLIDGVTFVESESDVLAGCDAVVVARDPQSQRAFLLRHSQTLASLRHLFLEKPLAESVEHAAQCLDILASTRTPYSLGYLFPFTRWFRDLQRLTRHSCPEVSIEWRIPITSSTWKDEAFLGGGVSSFFLVHFVPVMQQLGMDSDACSMRVEGSRYVLELQSAKRLRIRSEMTTSNFGFRVSIPTHHITVFEDETPFGARPRRGVPDPRLGALRRYMAEFVASNRELPSEWSPLELEKRVIRFRLACRAAGIP